ncbi:hypothetical protein M5K25_021955 [Dendrobium thyrsiflorum]|uniref:CSD domain-containing protein n=1 Tax=Dendrobium thyrsiflorum TaxID=117978 RepID=A0ABD0U5G8_DENTH
MNTYAVKAQWKRSISYLLYAAEIAEDFKRLPEDAEDWDFTMKKHPNSPHSVKCLDDVAGEATPLSSVAYFAYKVRARGHLFSEKAERKKQKRISSSAPFLSLLRSSGEMVGDRLKGTVKWFNATKRFGFITPDDGREELFVHQSSIKADGFQRLAEGEVVEFAIAVGEDGRTKAVDVTSPGRDFVQGGNSAAAGGRRGGYGGGGGRGGGSKGEASGECKTRFLYFTK